MTARQLPLPVLDLVAHALLFYVRGFRCVAIGTPSERFVPSAALSEDLGERALAALDALGGAVVLAAMGRAGERP